MSVGKCKHGLVPAYTGCSSCYAERLQTEVTDLRERLRRLRDSYRDSDCAHEDKICEVFAGELTVLLAADPSGEGKE